MLFVTFVANYENAINVAVL